MMIPQDGMSAREARLRWAQEASGIYAFEIDADRMVHCDDGLRALFGLAAGTDAPAETPAAETWAARVHPEDRARTLAAFARLRQEGGALTIAFRAVTPDGTTRWLQSRAGATPGPPGQPRRVFGMTMQISARQAGEAQLRAALESTSRDVTEARRAERALAESEARLRSIFEQAAVGFAQVGLDGAWQRVNRRLCEMLGYTEAELRACRFQDITHPDDLAQDLARVRQLLAGEIATYGMEKRYIRKDGAPLWVNLTVSLLRDGAGTPQHFISVVEDISPRKAIEATLRAFYEVSPLLMGTVELLDDGDLLHRYDNPATNRFFGAAPGSTHGRTARALGLPEATIAEWRARYEEAAARDGPVSFECGYDTGPTPPRRLAVTVAPLGTGPEGQPLFCYVAEDVTARHAAEAALAESEARFRAITEAMPQMVWSARPDGYTDFFNRRWYDMTGAPPGSLRGDTWHLFAHPDDGPAMLASWREAASRGQPYEVEYRLRMADGRHRWVLARALPVRDANGRVTRWFGTCTDIEDIRRAREVLARDRAELEQLVQERTLELQRAQARLAWAEKMTALGQLAGGVAHDFNNVMQTVAGAAGLIRRRPGDAAAVDRYAGMIENAAERGTSVTRRLLTFARHGELQAGPVEVAGLLEGLREVLAHTLGVGVAIRLDVAAALPPALADRGQLETALINLATNARDAMPAGGTLTLSAAMEMVADGPHPEGLAAGAYVRIGVSDCGTGMDAATLARVMEPFFTTKPRGQGTGLGLPMARGFAEQSGGALALASAAGRGTTVTLWLPVAASSVGDGGTAARAAPPARPAAPRILLVDDDGPVREVLAAHLAGHGYDVAAAPDGAAALALLDSGAAPDLLVSDLAMPGMDGLALIREAQRRRAALPAILLTGYAGDAAPLPAGGTDANGVTLLRKPVSGAHLAERVAMLLAATPRT